MRGKRQAQKAAKRLKDLWAARPFSGWPHEAMTKRLCRRVERRKARQEARQIRDNRE